MGAPSLVKNQNIIPRPRRKHKGFPRIGDNLPHVCSQGGGSFMYLVVLGVYVVLAVAAAWVMALLRRR